MTPQLSTPGAPPTATPFAIPSEDDAFGSMTNLEFIQANEQTTDPKTRATLDALKFRQDTDRATLSQYTQYRQARGLDLFPERTATANAERSKFLRGLYTKPLAEVVPPDALARIQSAATASGKPEEFTQGQINRAFLSTVINHPLEGAAYNAARELYGRQHLKLEGEITDATFYQAIKARHDEEDKAAAATRKLANDTFANVLTGQPEDRKAIDAHLSQLSPQLRQYARESLSQARADAAETRRRNLPAVNRIAEAVDYIRAKESDAWTGDTRETALRRLIVDMAAELPDDLRERNLALAMIGQKLSALPEDTRPALIRVYDTIQRSTNSLVEAGKTINYEMFNSIAGIADGPTNRGPKRKGQLEEIIDARTKVAALKGIIQGQALNLSNAYDTLAIRSTLAAAQSLPYTALAFSPYGLPVMFATMAGQSVQDARIANPNTNANLRLSAALLSGVIQAATERMLTPIGLKLASGRIPTLTQILNKGKIFNPMVRGATGAVLGASATIASETVEEVAQDATDTALQQVASELSGQNPNVDWNKFLHDWTKTADGKMGDKLQQTLLAIGPFALLAGGVAGIHHVKNAEFYLKSVPFMKASGFNTEEVSSVLNAPDSEAALEALKTAFNASQNRPLTPEQEAEAAATRAAALDIIRQQAKLREDAGAPVIETAPDPINERDTYFFTDPTTGERTEYDTEEKALTAFQEWGASLQTDALSKVHEAAAPDFIQHITDEGQAGEGIDITNTGERNTLGIEQSKMQKDEKTASEDLRRATSTSSARAAESRLANARANLSALQSRFELFLIDHNITPAAGAELFKSIPIRAASMSQMVAGKIVGWTVKLYEGHTIGDIAEDVSETILKRGIADNLLNPHIIVDEIRQFEKASGNPLLPAGYDYTSDDHIPLVEAFSKLSRGYLLAEMRNSQLPPTVKAWAEMVTAFSAATVDAAKTQAAEILRDMHTAADLRRAIAAGTMPERLRARLADAIGLNETERMARLEKQMQDQLAAEAMGGFPEISQVLKGRLPHPATAIAKGLPLAGELRRVYNALIKPTRGKNKKGQQIDRTNEARAYFLPEGVTEDIDAVRRSINQDGFAFDTPAEMLDALELSLGYGKPQYGTASPEFGDASYSLGAETLHQTLIDNIGENALLVEQPRASYEDKKQLLLDFSKSITGPSPQSNSQGINAGRLGPVQIIAQSIAKDLELDPRVHFIGETIKNSEDLVKKCQVLRNPLWETFYLLGVTPNNNGGWTLIDSMAVTSRVPCCAQIFTGDKKRSEGIAEHAEFLKNAGASHYFLIHNHPSADPTPSRADISTTERHAKEMEDVGLSFVQHIVINHLTYSTISRFGNVSTLDLPSKQNSPDPYANIIAGLHSEILDNPEAVVRYGQSVQTQKEKQNGLVTGILTDTRYKVRATIQGTIEQFLKLTADHLVEYGRKQGASFMMLHTVAEDAQHANQLLDSLKQLNSRKLATEIVIEHGTEYISMLEKWTQTHFMPRFFGKELEIKGERVQDNVGNKSFAFAGLEAIKNQTEAATMQDNLATARAMAAQGKDPEEIRAITGWFPGKYDGKLRFELPDQEASINDLTTPNIGWAAVSDMQNGNTIGLPIDKVLNFPAFFEAYPKARDIWLRIVPGKKGGSYNPESNVIVLGIADNKTQLGEHHLSVLLHEVQHWIQEAEGFAIGGNTELAALWQKTQADGGEQINNRQDVKDWWTAHQNIAESTPDSELEQALKEFSQSAPESLKKWWDRKMPTNWKDMSPMKLYQLFAGEIEARDIQARMNYTPEQRAAIAPYSSENIAKDEAIILSNHKDAGNFSFALSVPGLLRLDSAIVKIATQGPDERADYYERLRNRLAALTLIARESKRNINPDQTDAERERNRIRDAIAEANAIRDTLPMEARGRLRFSISDLTSAETERGTINALIRLIADADDALESTLSSAYREAFEKLIDLAKPDLRQNKTLRGRLTPEIQRQVAVILDITTMSPEEHQAAVTKTEAAIADLYAKTPQSAEEATQMQAQATALEIYYSHLSTFGPWQTMDAAGLASAYEQLQSLYSRGRTARVILDEARREEIRTAKRELLSSLPEIDQAQHSDAVHKPTKTMLLEAARLSMSSFHQVMEYLFPNSVTARDIQKRVRAADRAFTWAKINGRERFDNFTFEVWNLTGISRTRQRNGILHDLSTQRTDWNVQLMEGVTSEKISLTEDQAKAILDGKLKTGWETDQIALLALAQSLADFRMKRLKAQNEDRSFTAKTIHFTRIKSRGKPGPYHASDMESVYLLQLWAQEQYRPALDKYGFTESVIQQIEKKLNPKALDVADYLRTEYDAEYSRLNPIYQTIFGMDMPRIRNYAPGAFEHLDSKAGGATIDPYGEANAVNAMSAGFTKARTHHMARPKEQNALAAYWQHFESTEYFIAYAELMRDVRQIFRSPELRRRIVGIHGEEAAKLFSQWLDALEIDGNFKAATVGWFGNLSAKMISTQAAIGLSYNIGVLLKQITAVFGVFMDSFSVKDATVGMFNAIMRPETLKTVLANEAIQQRILEGISPEDRKLLHAGAASPSTIVELLQIGRMPIAYADAALTALSGAAAYNIALKHAKKAGLSPTAADAHALSVASGVIERTAQPATTQDKSMAELTAKGFLKFLFLFKSDPRQKLAIVMQATSDYYHGKISGIEFARKFFFNWAIYGLAAEACADIWQGMTRDDDDPERWSWRDYLVGALVGPLAGIPIAGQAIEYVLRATVGTKAFINSSSPLEQGLSRLPQQLPQYLALLHPETPEHQTNINEFLTKTQQITSAIAQIAGAYDPRAAIVPALLRAARDVEGIAANTVDLFTGPDLETKTLAITREIAAEMPKPRDGQAEQNDQLAKDLSKLDKTTQAERLGRMPKDQRDAVKRKMRAASMTRGEAALSRLPKDLRQKAVQKLLETMSQDEAEAYQARLETLGLAK